MVLERPPSGCTVPWPAAGLARIIASRRATKDLPELLVVKLTLPMGTWMPRLLVDAELHLTRLDSWTARSTSKVTVPGTWGWASGPGGPGSAQADPPRPSCPASPWPHQSRVRPACTCLARSSAHEIGPGLPASRAFSPLAKTATRTSTPGAMGQHHRAPHLLVRVPGIDAQLETRRSHRLARSLRGGHALHRGNGLGQALSLLETTRLQPPSCFYVVPACPGSSPLNLRASHHAGPCCGRCLR